MKIPRGHDLSNNLIDDDCIIILEMEGSSLNKKAISPGIRERDDKSKSHCDRFTQAVLPIQCVIALLLSQNSRSTLNREDRCGSESWTHLRILMLYILSKEKQGCKYNLNESTTFCDQFGNQSKVFIGSVFRLKCLHTETSVFVLWALELLEKNMWEQIQSSKQFKRKWCNLQLDMCTLPCLHLWAVHFNCPNWNQGM